jgi:uncharacterized phage protein (TIGR02216 family)
MAAALGGLRLEPRAFWAMTLKELEAALGLAGWGGQAAPGRDELSRLMTRFPDR